MRWDGKAATRAAKKRVCLKKKKEGMFMKVRLIFLGISGMGTFKRPIGHVLGSFHLRGKEAGAFLCLLPYFHSQELLPDCSPGGTFVHPPSVCKCPGA